MQIDAHFSLKVFSRVIFIREKKIKFDINLKREKLLIISFNNKIYNYLSI